nr:hypothetical protein [Sulfuracidifex tepidarius]
MSSRLSIPLCSTECATALPRGSMESFNPVMGSTGGDQYFILNNGSVFQSRYGFNLQTS